MKGKKCPGRAVLPVMMIGPTLFIETLTSVKNTVGKRLGL
jgi:hypothetical protein